MKLIMILLINIWFIYLKYIKNKICKKEILNYYGLNGLLFPSKYNKNLWCDNIDNNCCSKKDQLKIFEYITKSYINEEKRFSELVKLEIEKLERLYGDIIKNIDLSNKVLSNNNRKYRFCKNTKSILEKFDFDNLKTHLFSNFINSREYFNKLHHSFFCLACNYDFHTYFNIKVKEVVVEKSFCIKIIKDNYDLLKNWNIILIRFLDILQKHWDCIFYKKEYNLKFLYENNLKLSFDFGKCFRKNFNIEYCKHLCDLYNFEGVSTIFEGNYPFLKEINKYFKYILLHLNIILNRRNFYFRNIYFKKKKLIYNNINKYLMKKIHIKNSNKNKVYSKNLIHRIGNLNSFLYSFKNFNSYRHIRFRKYHKIREMDNFIHFLRKNNRFNNFKVERKRFRIKSVSNNKIMLLVKYMVKYLIKMPIRNNYVLLRYLRINNKFCIYYFFKYLVSSFKRRIKSDLNINKLINKYNLDEDINPYHTNSLINVNNNQIDLIEFKKIYKTERGINLFDIPFSLDLETTDYKTLEKNLYNNIRPKNQINFKILNILNYFKDSNIKKLNNNVFEDFKDYYK